MLGKLGSCSERAVSSEEAEEDLNSVCCRSANYIHGEIGLLGVDRSKTVQQGLGCCHSIRSGGERFPYLLMDTFSCRMCSTLHRDGCCAVTCATPAQTSHE